MLTNGMTILVQEDPSIPNIAFYISYRFGLRNEHEGITGLSHFFEHMMSRDSAARIRTSRLRFSLRTLRRSSR